MLLMMFRRCLGSLPCAACNPFHATLFFLAWAAFFWFFSFFFLCCLLAWCHQVPCNPMTTLLGGAASGGKPPPHIDLLIVDVEVNYMSVLNTLPWEVNFFS
jgi:hypothetical protein